jgi:hypothetical protein
VSFDLNANASLANEFQIIKDVTFDDLLLSTDHVMWRARSQQSCERIRNYSVLMLVPMVGG